MYPYIELFHLQIPTYSLMAIVGMLVSIFFAEHQAVKAGIHPYYMIELLLIGAVGSLVGSHLLYGIVNLHQLGRISIFEVFGGSVFYGGLLSGLLTAYLYARRKKYPLALYADIGALALPLFHGFGRIGCFLGGCCYGVEWSHGFTMTHSASGLGEGVARFPVQLLEAAALFALFSLLFYFYQKQKLRGLLMPLYLGLYAIIRFLDEFLRGDAYRGFLGPFSTSQWISLAILVGVGAYLLHFRGRARQCSCQ